MGKYLFFALALVMLCACDKDKSGALSEEEVIRINNDEEGLTSESMEFYKNITPPAPTNMRKGIVMTEPEVPVDAKNFTGQTTNGTNYKVSENTENWSISIGEKCNFYVTDNAIWTLKSAWYGGVNDRGNQSVIHVLSGSTLNLENINSINQARINIYEGATIKVNGTLIIGSAELNIAAEKKDFGSVRLENGAKLYIGGEFKATALQVVSSEAEFNSCVEVVGNIAIENKTSKVNVKSFLKFTELDFSSGKLNIASGSLIQGEKFIIRNRNNVRIGVVGGDAYSVIKVGTLKLYSNDMIGVFNENLAIDWDVLEDNLSGKGVEWGGTIRVNKKNTSIVAEGCRPAYDAENTEPEIGPTFDNIAKIKSPGTDISATSVSYNNISNTLFVSWHLNAGPNDYKGYIDIVTLPVEDGQGNFITPSMITSRIESDYVDYNHTMFYKDKLYTAGGSKKGALVSVIPINGALITNEQQIIRLNGASGNCVAGANFGNKERIIAISGANGGIEVFSDLTFAQEGVRDELSYVKYVDVTDNRLAILRGGSEAELILSEDSDLDDESKIKTIKIGSISPVDGKNVVKVDDDAQKIYVAAGDRGLLIYNFNGELVSQYTDNKTKKEIDGHVNGVAFDDKYIYVAYGLKGIHVLDKATSNYVHHYLFDELSDASVERASANFVAVDGDYIYVAYGKDGVHIMKFDDGKTN